MNEKDHIKKWVEGSLSNEERATFEQSDAFKSIERII
jgi:hypothetical protein